MKKFLAFAVVGLLFAVPAMATTAINEIRIDDSGSDTDEYFELSGMPGESLDGLWYIVIGDFSAGVGNGGRSGRVEYAIDLTGMTIGADGYFLAGNAATLGTDIPAPDAVDLDTILTFENGDNVTHMLVSDYTGAPGNTTEDIDTNKDGVPNAVLPWSSIVDSLALVETANPPTTTYNEWSYAFGGASNGPDGSFVPAHSYRYPNGTGAWNIGDFFGANDTPGTANLPEPTTALLLVGGAVLAMRRRR